MLPVGAFPRDLAEIAAVLDAAGPELADGLEVRLCGRLDSNPGFGRPRLLAHAVDLEPPSVPPCWPGNGWWPSWRLRESCTPNSLLCGGRRPSGRACRARGAVVGGDEVVFAEIGPTISLRSYPRSHRYQRLISATAKGGLWLIASDVT